MISLFDYNGHTHQKSIKPKISKHCTGAGQTFKLWRSKGNKSQLNYVANEDQFNKYTTIHSKLYKNLEINWVN